MPLTTSFPSCHIMVIMHDNYEDHDNSDDHDDKCVSYENWIWQWDWVLFSQHISPFPWPNDPISMMMMMIMMMMVIMVMMVIMMMLEINMMMIIIVN